MLKHTKNSKLVSMSFASSAEFSAVLSLSTLLGALRSKFLYATCTDYASRYIKVGK